MNSKCVNVIKPCQSGKTFYTIQKIADFLDDAEDKSVIVIFCDNKLLLVDQTTSRIETAEDLQVYKNDEGDLSVILSSKSETTRIEGVHFAITERGIRNVVLCSNKRRMQDLSTLLGYKAMRYFKFYIVIDEVDKYFKAFYEFIEDWTAKDNVHAIYMLTATPDELFNKYNTINIIPMKETFKAELYHPFKECNFVLHHAPATDTAEDYVRGVLETHTTAFKPGTVLFVPANVKKESHYDAKDELLRHGFVVLCINGDGKTLFFSRHESIKLAPGDACVADWIADYYLQYGLVGSKFAITGNLCIERGITISSDRLMITHAILPPNITKKATAYQIAGRMCGNFKQFPNYAPPTVFCTKLFQKRVLESERKAMNIAADCYKESQDSPVQVTKSQMKVCGKEDRGFNVEVKLYDHFRSLADVERFQRQLGLRKFNDPTKSMVDGFYQTSLAGTKQIYSADQITNWLRSISPESNFDVKKKPESREGYYVSRLYIGYDDIKDPTSVHFFLRVGHVTPS